MIHARPDYNRFQDPALDDPSLLGEGCSPIAADEPVFLLRAKDKHMAGALHDYLSRVINDGDPDMDLINAIAGLVEMTRRWQLKNGAKTPDLPKG